MTELSTGFLLQAILSAAAIALSIKYNAPEWVYYGAVLLAFLGGAKFVLSYQPDSKWVRLIAVAAYVAFSIVSVSVLTLLLFCSLKTCS